MQCTWKEYEQTMASDYAHAARTAKDQDTCRQPVKESFPKPLTVVFLVWGFMFALAGLCLAFIR